MIRRLVTVAIATVLIATLPTLLTAAVDPDPSGIQTAAQPAPEPDYPPELSEAAYPEPDWALMERCWTGIDDPGPSAVPPGCSGAYPLSLYCHWTVSYPSRGWVEEACGPIDSWGPTFGEGWFGAWNPHPGRDWVQRIKAGGQP